MTMAGFPQRTVMAMLGHRDPRMAMRHQHLTPNTCTTRPGALNRPVTERLSARQEEAR
jgi:hypothetical protein